MNTILASKNNLVQNKYNASTSTAQYTNKYTVQRDLSCFIRITEHAYSYALVWMFFNRTCIQLCTGLNVLQQSMHTAMHFECSSTEHAYSYALWMFFNRTCIQLCTCWMFFDRTCIQLCTCWMFFDRTCIQLCTLIVLIFFDRTSTIV